MNELYDLESVYDEQIAPLMAQVIAICKEHKLPMLASFQYAVREDEGFDFCTTQLFMAGRTISNNLESAAREIARQPFHMLMTITSVKKA